MKRVRYFLNAVGCAAVILCGGVCAESIKPLEVTYLAADADDQRASYYEEVIRLALEKSEIPYSMKEMNAKMTHLRKIQSVVEGGLSVVWASSRPEVDAQLDPIKIPICGGLLGYRVFIIHRDLQSSLAEIDDLDGLRSFRIGQGVGWGDTAILENAGFDVDIAPYEALFKMTDAKRFDLFCRGIHEAHMEVNLRKEEFPSLIVDQHIGLHYPLVRFLYVKKGNEELKQALTLGLERMHADGSFREFLKNHPFMKPVLDQKSLKTRIWIELENPFIRPEDLKIAQKYFDQELLSGFHEPLEVLYVQAGEKDIRGQYYVDVLRLALDKSEVPYSMKDLNAEMSSLRKTKSVVDGGLSVLWANGHQNTEKILDPIRIPLCGGLLSYRGFIVHRETQSALAGVNDLETLRSYTVGQGPGWSDGQVLENAGFVVMKAKYHSLLKMVDAKRFDLLPRGIHEAYAEVALWGDKYPSLMVDPHVGLYYPQVSFFYVREGNEQLKQAITIGLERAYADGSFYEFFRTHSFIRPVLDREDRIERSWFEIENPLLPPEDWEAAQKYFDQELLDSIRR